MKLQALRLSRTERDDLLRTLIANVDGEPEGTSNEIAGAWDEEIARRIADHEAGTTTGIPADEVFVEIRAMIAGHRWQ